MRDIHQVYKFHQISLFPIRIGFPQAGFQIQPRTCGNAFPAVLFDMPGKGFRKSKFAETRFGLFSF